jgi:hypothetical protein
LRWIGLVADEPRTRGDDLAFYSLSGDPCDADIEHRIA